VNWADLMAAQGAFGTDFYDRSKLRPMHRAYHRSGIEWYRVYFNNSVDFTVSLFSIDC